MINKLFLPLLIFLNITNAFGVQEALDSNIYRQEFKALRKQRVYKTLFDRRSTTALRKIIGSVELVKELSPMGIWLRSTLFEQNPIVISSVMMPQLYAYVENICQQQHMRMPTIFITKDKTTALGFSTAHTDSTKYLMSSGAILIGQDLLFETSQQSLEAAIAHEIANIKYNRNNINVIVNWISPSLISCTLPSSITRNKALFSIASFLLPRVLMGKQFEKQADAFVYKTMNNAEGLIELCQYFQRKKQKIEDDYADTYAFLQNANINFVYYIVSLLAYYPNYIGHKLYNGYEWICYNTPLRPYQSYQARIQAAQRYLATKKI